MILHHLKTGWRNLRNNRVYAAVTILGLGIGVGAVLLIFQMLQYEWSFNKNFKNYERIVRVVSSFRDAQGSEYPGVCVPRPAAEQMISAVPQFEKTSRIKETWSTLTIPNPDGGAPLKKFDTPEQEPALFAETAFFQIFDFQWLAGDPLRALQEPNTLVLTRAWAEKCFGSWENVLGKTLLIDHIFPVTVTGVVENPPTTSDFDMPYLISYATLQGREHYFLQDDGDWDSCNSNHQVYALLSDPEQMEAANAVVGKIGEKEYTGNKGWRERVHGLQPLSDVHYDERYASTSIQITSKSRLQVLAFIGLLILVLACFNFINLATAQSTLRAREVGVRKTLGGKRSQLVAQFFSETGLIVLVAVVLGAGLAKTAAPLLRWVSNVPEEQPLWSNPAVWLFLVAVMALVTLLAGFYPAMALAGFNPIQAFRSNAQNTRGSIGLRKSLVVLQFVIAQGLIIGAIVTILQLDYIRSQDLGFEKELVYTFPFGGDSMSIQRQEALRRALSQIPSVLSASFSSDQPLSDNTWASDFRYADRPESEPFQTALKFADANYRETYGIRMLTGRWLAPSDTMREAVLNRSLLQKLGIQDPEKALGQIFFLWSSRPLKIVGIAEDFHTHTFHTAHQPLIMTTDKTMFWEAGVKIRSGDLAATTAAIRGAFDAVLPEQVFKGKFLDAGIDRLYEDDQRLSATCRGFGLLAIVISCLGLFGLATHAATQRVKEIGIRKVLGATTAGIVAMLSREFLQLVVISLLIASPIAWYLMQNWLENFVFHVEIKWYVFTITGFLALLVAFLTVGFQGWRAARANPVKSLRSE